jgi:hypothetical protein
MTFFTRPAGLGEPHVHYSYQPEFGGRVCPFIMGTHTYIIVIKTPGVGSLLSA